MSRPVAVIGGGWAGCAAAAVLAGHGVPVALYESGSTLGGRARRVERDDLPLDNGQHLLLGAYSATRTLLWAVHEHVVDAGLMRLPLSMRPLSPTQVEAITVSAWRLPPPFDLLLGLFTASGLSLSERSAAVAWYMRLRRQRFQCPTGQT